MNRNLKRGLIAVGILFALVIVAYILLSLFISSKGIGGPQPRPAELETIQTAVQAMMIDNDLNQVTPSTSGVGGEKIRSTGTQFHPALDMQHYMDPHSTQFCYRWQSDGRITYQYDADDDGNCAADTDQLFP